jgi:hypothetical protein
LIAVWREAEAGRLYSWLMTVARSDKHFKFAGRPTQRLPSAIAFVITGMLGQIFVRQNININVKIKIRR